MVNELQKLHKVTWTDVVEITSPTEEIKDYKKQLAVIESIGYIIQNDDDILVLAKDTFEGKPEQVLIIPKPLVNNVEEVGEIDKQEKSKPLWMDAPKGERKSSFTVIKYKQGENSYRDFEFEMNNRLLRFTVLDSEPPTQKVEAIWKTRKSKREDATIEDEGQWECGATKDDLFEAFLYGNKYKGRWVARKVKLRIRDMDNKPIEGKCRETWFLWKPDNQDPYTTSRRAMEKGWYPQKETIPIPAEWIRKHPEEFKEWYDRAKGKWTEEMAIEETENEIRARIQSPSKFDSDSFRRKPFPPNNPQRGVHALYACPRGNWSGGRCQVGMQIQAFRFAKSAGWTISKARTWLTGHNFKVI